MFISKYKIFSLIIILGSFCVAGFVNAAGIGVSPKSITVHQSADMRTTSEVFVHNTGKKPALVSIVADQWPQLITASPNQFELKPGESEQVSVSFEHIPYGDYATYLSVIARDLDDGTHQPRTGIKIPLDMHISAGDQLVQFNYSVLVIGFLLIALVLMIWSMARYHYSSGLRKAVDIVRESRARGSFTKTVRHYSKYHALLIVSLFALIAAVALLYLSFVSDPNLSKGASAVNTSGSSVSLTINDPDESVSYSLHYPAGERLSVLDSLVSASSQYGFSLSFDPPSEMGVLVTEIGGYTNGLHNRYWLYQVNDEYVPVAADRYFLNPFDQVKWEFKIPQ